MSETDWERIECEYRAGVLSTREIAGAHGLSHTAINKRAKANDWVRDLSAKIRAKADALVSKAAVSTEVSISRLATEREVVDANAAQIAKIRGEHRADFLRARTLALKFLAELEEPEDDLALPARVSTLKALTEALKNLVAMEREAYGIDKVPETPPDIERIDPVEGARRAAFVLSRAAKMATHPEPKAVQ